MSSLEQIKNLRERTGAGIVEVKKALEEAVGDEAKAVDILRKKSKDKAIKKADRVAGEGIVAAYVHSNNRIGAIVRLLCETDFVARNEEFKELAQDIAMHITAMNPQFVRPEDVAPELIEKEKEIWTEQLKNENKPKEIMEKILKGKENKFREEISRNNSRKKFMKKFAKKSAKIFVAARYPRYRTRSLEFEPGR